MPSDYAAAAKILPALASAVDHALSQLSGLVADEARVYGKGDAARCSEELVTDLDHMNGVAAKKCETSATPLPRSANCLHIENWGPGSMRL